MDGVYYNLWSTDNDKTTANDDVVIKSVYDPNPVGYSLPASNAFTGFTTTGVNAGIGNTPGNPDHFNVKFPFDKGWYFYTKPGKTGDTTFFSIFGYRDAGSGFLRDVPLVGWYWVAGPSSKHNGRYFYFVSHAIFPLDNYLRSLALAVRSAEEKKLRYGGWRELQIVFGLREVYYA